MSKGTSKKAKPTDPRNNAYQRLLKAIQAIPGESPREKMRKFTAFALKVCVINQAEELFTRGFGPLVAWCDLTLLGTDVQGSEDWCHEAGQAYGGAVETFEPFECILGRLFNELVWSGKKNDAQHFTPWGLARAMNAFAQAPQKDEWPMGDPTCGAGTLLLVKLHELAGKDSKALRGLTVKANDRDPLCAAMTALQLLSNQLIWRMPIGRVVVECKDIITQYLETRVVFWSLTRDRFIAMDEEIRLEKANRVTGADMGAANDE
ncbi:MULTISPECIES: hypothetical protein [Gammaproteobacteria]|jgi:hypothetical protein|uniref:DNA methylase adenine-specific domain-containing protein n=3 Tax=Bacteria TaxID=2 RepID=A0A699Y0J1_STEMA|nr:MULTISPECIES: hypothetical protein [Stenotrophomonas]EKT2104506.1 hypothetical protein [Stenotrophomonas maltophilia]EKT4074491.1 hypothetical protein [Stenotrophomonas maltophilia]EKT4084581.1 hypothetical protein [Stenotrophomonas maltophilia]EKT4092233.1 hypothetical protein [Stenotrophomonas maltophilia]EKU9961878.1 hypothetical protein [Stenotrophomonas maltophilia]